MNRVLIFAGSGNCGSAAGAMPHGNDAAIGNTLSRNILSSRNTRDSLSPADQHRHRVGTTDGRDRHDRHPGADRHLHKTLAAGQVRAVPLAPRPQRVDLTAGPHRDISPLRQRGGHRVRCGGKHTHRPEVAADERHRHQHIVRGAMQRPVLAEPSPPLHPDRPRVPNERRTRVNADQAAPVDRAGSPSRRTPSGTSGRRGSSRSISDAAWSPRPHRSAPNRRRARSATP